MVFKGQDAWRKHPFIYECWKKPLPHLGTAFAVFGVICVIDFAIKKIKGPDDHGHGHGHDKAHH